MRATMSRHPAALLALGLALALAGPGCADLGRYSTAPGESYCGAVTASSSFRTGLDPGVQMRLQLDASELDGEASPGTVWTFEAASAAAPARRLLDAAPLRRIPTLDSDPLSQLSLGEGRDPSRIFALTPASPAEDPFVGVLSLRSDGGVEVRLLRPGLGGAPPEGKQPVFGLFTLYQQAGTCGF
jgi:hypothetical protein